MSEAALSLHLILFGAVQVSVGGRLTAGLSTDKTSALLAYLVVEDMNYNDILARLRLH